MGSWWGEFKIVHVFVMGSGYSLLTIDSRPKIFGFCPQKKIIFQGDILLSEILSLTEGKNLLEALPIFKLMQCNLLICSEKWATSWQNQQNGMCTHQRQISLGIRPVWLVFAVRLKKARILSYPLGAQRRLWLDWAGAQADLNFRWVDMPFCLFCHDVAQIYKSQFSFEMLPILDE